MNLSSAWRSSDREADWRPGRSPSVYVARKTAPAASAEACSQRRCRPALFAHDEIDCPKFVRCIERGLGSIGLTEHLAKERDDLGELSREGQEQQDDEEQIGKLSHQMSLGRSRAALVDQVTRVHQGGRRGWRIWTKPWARPARLGPPAQSHQQAVNTSRGAGI